MFNYLKKQLRYTIIIDIVKKMKLNKFRKKWRYINKNNETIPMNIFDSKLVSVGKYSYGELNVISFNKNSKLKIGSLCSIAQNVKFILDADHRIDTISTFPFKVKIFKEIKYEAISKGDIIIEDDVWIGYGAMILSGVKIGQGAVIAAGAIVTRDVPPYAIVGGIPARILKYRFSQDIIKILLNIDYDKFDKAIIFSNKNLLEKKIDKTFCDSDEWKDFKIVFKDGI